LWKSKSARFGAIMAAIVVIISIVAPPLAPYAPSYFSRDLLHPPSYQHYMGTDEHGRDLFSRILYGGRITLLIAFVTVCLGGLLGIIWGLVAAYARGIAEHVLNRFIDISMSFPSIMTALFVLAIFGAGGEIPLVIAIALSLAPRFARVIRGATLPVLAEDFITAAKVLGAGHIRIQSRHVLPNIVAPITVLFSIYLPYVIILEASLSFLGLGVPPDMPTWGRIIADGKKYMQIAPWLMLCPGFAIIFTSVSFNILGDGLRDLFDPRSKARLSKEYNTQ
jgi:peptide/nickel transport system permease protein